MPYSVDTLGISYYFLKENRGAVDCGERGDAGRGLGGVKGGKAVDGLYCMKD